MFYVQSYEDPRDRRKAQEKANKVRREYERRPSVFDKLLDDNYLNPDAAPEPSAFMIPSTRRKTCGWAATVSSPQLGRARPASRRRSRSSNGSWWRPVAASLPVPDPPVVDRLKEIR